MKDRKTNNFELDFILPESLFEKSKIEMTYAVTAKTKLRKLILVQNIK